LDHDATAAVGTLDAGFPRQLVARFDTNLVFV